MATSMRPEPQRSLLAKKKAEDIVASMDPDMVKVFIDLAKERHSEENVGFLFAVEQFRSKAAHKQFHFPLQLYKLGLLIPQSEWGGLNTMGRWVYKTYIPQGAPFQVNIKSETRVKLEHTGKAKGTPFLPKDFDDAFREIAALVTSDWLNRIAAPSK